MAAISILKKSISKFYSECRTKSVKHSYIKSFTYKPSTKSQEQLIVGWLEVVGWE